MTNPQVGRALPWIAPRQPPGDERKGDEKGDQSERPIEKSDRPAELDAVRVGDKDDDEDHEEGQVAHTQHCW